MGISISIGNRIGSGVSRWSPQNVCYERWKITGAGNLVGLVRGDILIVGGTPGSYTFQVPNTAPYQTYDIDYIWFKTDLTWRTATEAEMVGYDFARTIVKYLNIAPYTISEIIILSSALTTDEMNHLRDYADLSIWWSNTLSFHGSTKQNRLSEQSVWTPELVVEDETAALVARMTAVGETPDAARITVLDTVIALDKAQIGFTNQYDAMWLLAAHGNDSGLLNIIKDAHNITLVNTPDFTVDRGYKGNGSDEALNSNYNPSTQAVKYLLNGASVGIYIRDNVDELAHDFSAEPVAGMSGLFFISDYAGDCYSTINSANYDSIANNDSRGMWIITRINNTQHIVYRNGVLFHTFTRNSSAIINAILYLMCENKAGTLARYSTKQIALAFAGGTMTQTDVTNFQTIWVDGYLNAVGAKV